MKIAFFFLLAVFAFTGECRNDLGTGRAVMSDAVAENTDYLWDTKIYGSPIGGGQVWDYSACNSMCIYNSGCHSWTYDTDDLCQLYSSYDPPTGYAADYVSGTFVSASNRFYRGTSPKPR